MTEEQLAQLLAIIETYLRSGHCCAGRCVIDGSHYKIIMRHDTAGRFELIVRERYRDGD